MVIPSRRNMRRFDVLRSHVIAVALITLYGVQKGNGLRCHLCNANEPAEFCNATSDTVLCRGTEDACITRITPSDDGPISWKACIEHEACARETADDPMACDIGLVQTSCSYCCQEDFCNVDRFGYNSPDVTCHVDEAREILATLETEVAERRNLEDLCGGRMADTMELVAEKTEDCDDDFKERINDVTVNVNNRLRGACQPTTPAPGCNMEAARACVFAFWSLIRKDRDPERICREIQRTWDCVERHTASCTEEERQSIRGKLEKYVDQVDDICTVIKSATPCNERITLLEGHTEHEFQFKSIRSPSSLCGQIDDCKIYVEFIVAVGHQPRCNDGRVIEQIVFKKSPDGSSCSTEITRDNWRDTTHTVTMMAKLDKKIDRDQTRTVTMVMKKVVNGAVTEVRSICDYQVAVIDRDSNKICSSMNDPHLITFDQHLYHNFRDGEYILYRHMSLPYQVNALHQKCTGIASCNCGVAVKSGDSVFVAEICRRRTDICPFAGSYCSGPQLRTHIYTHGSASPNMRIFSTNGGNSIDVLLPHGTIVRIELRGGYINIWVLPSPFDLNSVEGLCGFYDNHAANDLLLRNGDIYRGPGSEHNGHPNAFNANWQVLENEHLFLGAPKNPYVPPHYCECPPGGAASGREDCQDDELVEDCDMNTATEVSPELFPTIDLDERVHGGRNRRDVTSQSGISFLASLDLEEDYDPPEGLVWEGSWSEDEAIQFCERFITEERDWARKCLQVPGVNSTLPVTNCVVDILVSGGTGWAEAAREAYTVECLNVLEMDTEFGQTVQGRLMERQIKNQLCPRDCSGHGTCEMATCVCDAGYVGVDCYFETGQLPGNLSLSEEGLCNIRASNCSIIDVFGTSFIVSDSLTCHLQPIEVSDSGMSQTGPPSTVSAHVFTRNQILCVAPVEGSYVVDVSNDGTTPSGESKMHLAHDPNCFDCYTDDHSEGPVCIRRSDSCVVEGHCFRPGETHWDDECYACAPSKSDSSLTRQYSAACYAREIIIAVVVVFLLFFIICIIIFCCCFRKRKAGDDNGFKESSARFRVSHYIQMTKAKPRVSSDTPT